MMENEQDFVGPVNIGNPVEFTIRELAEKVLYMIPESKSKLVFKPLPTDDPRQRQPDISLAKEKLRWEPKVALELGLEKTIQYFRNLLR
jgi:UDP-glucuronate decarboxylase